MKYSEYMKLKLILGNIIFFSSLYFGYKIWDVNIQNPYIFEIFLQQFDVYITLLIIYISMALHLCLGLQSILIDYIKNKYVIYTVNFLIGFLISAIFIWVFI